MRVGDLELVLRTAGRLGAGMGERGGGAGRGEEEQAQGEAAHGEILRRSLARHK